MTEQQLKKLRKVQNHQIMMNSMRWDEESAKIIREIVRSCKPGMDDWEKCQHVLLIRKFFLYALTKIPDLPDHVLWYWEDDSGVKWHLLKGNWDRTGNPFRGAGLLEDGNRKFPQDVHDKFNVSMAAGGAFVGNLDFIRASTRAIQSDTPEAWKSAEDVWRKMYPLNSTEPLPTMGDADSMKTDVLKNRCSDEIAKWALDHRAATTNSMSARGFGNSGCLNGAIEDLGAHCKWMRSTVSQAVDILATGDLAKALAMIDTLKCGPASCPMPQGSHNGDCLEITKSRIKSMMLAMPVQVPVKIQISPPSANPERERLLASEMFARGILVAAVARKEGAPIPVDFEKSWANVCGGLACASREGWKEFAVAVDREVGCIVPESMHNRPFDPLISRLKQAIITSEKVVELVQALQFDPTSANTGRSEEQSSNPNLPLKPKRSRTRKGDTPKWIAEALILLRQNPNLSGSEVARRVSVAKSTLTQHPLWKAASAQFQPHSPTAAKFEKRKGVRRTLPNAQSNVENDSSDKNS